MPEQEQAATSRNANEQHVHTPESGKMADAAQMPGAMSGNGDVEHVQRIAALRAMSPGELSEAQREELRLADAHQPKSNTERKANPTTHDDEHRAVPPEGGSNAQLSRTQDRNQQLLDGAQPSTKGESGIAGVHTETSGPPRSGDYSSD